MSYHVRMVTDAMAHWGAGQMAMRSDMREQFEESGRAIPVGPKWALATGEKVLALGGFEPSGAGASLGWYLTADLTPRDWVAARWATRTALGWARTRSIRRLHALTPGDLPEAARMLARLGFKLTGQEGDDAVMTLELK